MSVVLAAGRAWVAGTAVSSPAGFTFTSQSSYFCENDAPVTLTVATSSPSNPRIDICVVSVQDAFYSGSNNQAVASIVTGTPAPSPVAPSAPANSITVATIAVAANATTIVNANITNVAALVTVVNTAPASTATSLTALTAVTGAVGQRVGSYGLVPSSVVNGSVSANGVVTFSAAASVSVNGVFSTSFDNYMVVFNLVTSGAGTLNIVLRASGTDNTVGYDSNRQANINGTVAGSQTLNAANWVGSGSTGIAGGTHDGTLTLFGPALSVVGARAQMWNNITSNPMTTTASTYFASLLHRAAGPFDGFTFTPSTGTITGTLRVYGYSNLT